MHATISYIADPGDHKVPFTLDTHWSGAQRVPMRMAITDARPRVRELSLDRQGFTLTRVVSGVTDYTDQQQIARLWLPAVEDMIAKLTGAKWVTTWAPNLRFSNRSALSVSTSVAAPARAVHADLCPEFVPADVGQHPMSERAAAAMRKRLGGRNPRRWRVFNIWQQISPPPQDTPLAVCDLSSMNPDDILDGYGRLPDRPEQVFRLTFMKHNPQHRWFHFSDLLPGEAIVFSGLDPLAPVFGRVPHTAIDVEHPPACVVPRNSIEVRAIAVFEK